MAEKNRNQVMVLAAVGIIALYWWTYNEDPKKKKQRLEREAQERRAAELRRIFGRLNIIRSVEVPRYEDLPLEERKKYLVTYDKFLDEFKQLKNALDMLKVPSGDNLAYMDDLHKRLLILQRRNKSHLLEENIFDDGGLSLRASQGTAGANKHGDVANLPQPTNSGGG